METLDDRLSHAMGKFMKTCAWRAASATIDMLGSCDIGARFGQQVLLDHGLDGDVFQLDTGRGAYPVLRHGDMHWVAWMQPEGEDPDLYSLEVDFFPDQASMLGAFRERFGNHCTLTDSKTPDHPMRHVVEVPQHDLAKLNAALLAQAMDTRAPTGPAGGPGRRL